MLSVLVGGDGVCRGRRGVVNRRHVDGQCVGRRAVLSPVMDLELEAVVGGAVGIGGGVEGEIAGIDVGLADHLVQCHVGAVELECSGRLQ